MGKAITHPDSINAEWLTAIMQHSGALISGRVIDVQCQRTDAFNSHTSHLKVQYSPDAPQTLPTAFVLKLNTDTDWAKEAGKEEVNFYRIIQSQPTIPSIYIPCVAAEYDEDSGNSYLLLKDVSDTHAPPMTRERQISIIDGVPSNEQIASVVDALAQHHAWWWQHPSLHSDTFHVGYWSRNPERFERYLARRRLSWSRLLAQFGNELPPDIQALYESVLNRLPDYWQRYLQPRFQARTHLTLIHGDAYFSNFLCPKQLAQPNAHSYMLDWQSPSFDIGAHDLANLCAAFWMPQQRHEHQREQGILRRYLAQLHRHGVSHYEWDDLIEDYQHGLIYWLLVPVQDGGDGSPKDYWWPKMQCLIHAFQDWHCDALLQ